MDTSKLEEYIDQNRWLLNNGMISDGIKNNLFLYGSILHKQVQAVELSLKPEEHSIAYTLYASPKLLKSIELYNKLISSSGIIDLWRLRRLLKKEGVLDLNRLANQFVKDLCGSKWTATVTVIPFSQYNDTINMNDNKDIALDNAIKDNNGTKI